MFFFAERGVLGKNWSKAFQKYCVVFRELSKPYTSGEKRSQALCTDLMPFSVLAVNVYIPVLFVWRYSIAYLHRTAVRLCIAESWRPFIETRDRLGTS